MGRLERPSGHLPEGAAQDKCQGQQVRRDGGPVGTLLRQVHFKSWKEISRMQLQITEQEIEADYCTVA